MIENLNKLSLLSAALLSVGGTTLSATEKSRPNIVFILADDLGWQDVGFNGSKYFETPNLDKLAKQSVNLKRMYMYPTCSPSRASILTGKQSFRTQCYTVPVLEQGNCQDNIFSRWTVEAKHKFYSQPLNKAGYHLIHLGKWHVVGPNPEAEKNYPFQKKLTQPLSGRSNWAKRHKTPEIQQYYPLGRGFHENVGGTWWGDPAKGQRRGYAQKGGGYIAPYNNPFIKEGPAGEWLSDRLTNEAIRFIGENKDKKEPFFVNLQFYAPHRPSVARHPEWLKKFQNKLKDEKTGQYSGATKEIAAYATMVQAVDENVGRLLDYLDKQGLRENTLIVFTSDNGYNGKQSVNNNLRGCKGSVYEAGLRVPCLVNWPGKLKPGKVEEPVMGLDFFPTFLELAGILKQYTETLDGRSLLPLLKGKKATQRDLFWHITSSSYGKTFPCSIIRHGDWKLIQYLKDGKTELYNLKTDASESRDFSKSNTELVKELTNALVKWRRQNKVPLPPSSSLEY